VHVDVLHGIDGSLTVKVDDFDTEPVHGMEPFLFILARLRMQAQVANLDAVDFLMGPAATFQLEDGSGAVDMDVAVDHGHFAPESRVSYRTDHVSPTDDVAGSVDATVEDANGAVGKLQWRGSADAKATVKSAALREGSVHGRIAFAPFKVSNGAGGSSETTRAEIDGEVSFSDKREMSGQLRAKTSKFKGDLDDKRLAVSALTGDLRFTGHDARGTLEMHDMRASSNGVGVRQSKGEPSEKERGMREEGAAFLSPVIHNPASGESSK
jgi:hypothetical protein